MRSAERRLLQRKWLCLPVVVTGIAPDGTAWCEPTRSEEVSIAGASLRLSNKVAVGDRLRLRVQPFGAREIVAAEAIVTHVAPSPYGGAHAGVRVTRPRAAWFRFYRSWVTDEGEE